MDNSTKSINQKSVWGKKKKPYQKPLVREYEPGFSSADNYGNTNIKPMSKQQQDEYFEHMKELTGEDWRVYSTKVKN